MPASGRPTPSGRPDVCDTESDSQPVPSCPQVIKQTSGGDGALFQMSVDGRLVLGRVLKEQGERFAFSEVVSVQVGSEVAFSVNAVSNADNDSLWTRFIIETSNQTASVSPLPVQTEQGACDLLPGPPCKVRRRSARVGTAAGAGR